MGSWVGGSGGGAWWWGIGMQVGGAGRWGRLVDLSGVYRDAGWWCWLGWGVLGCRWVELDGEASGNWPGLWVGGRRQKTCLELRGHWGKSRVDELNVT